MSPIRLTCFVAVSVFILTAAPAFAETAGAQAMARGEYARAVREMTVAAKAGDAQAQLDLGLALLDGKGVGRDPAQAARWIRQAADKDLPEAQYEFGQLEEDGTGLDKNPADAADWYRKAAQHGNVPSMFSLGELYRLGEDVPKDEAQAARWYRAAGDKNDIDSQLALGKLYQDGLGVVKNTNDAAIWFRKAAQLGSPEGRYQLALLLLQGDPSGRLGHGPSHNTVEAMDWLRAAAEQDYAPAQFYLGMAHLNGVEAELDAPEGVRDLQQSADQAHPPALRQLGKLYAQGRVVPQDLVRAYMYLDLAVEEGDEGAIADRDELGRQISASQQQQAKKRAREWLDIRGL